MRLLPRICLVLLASATLAQARGKGSKHDDDDIAVTDDDSDDTDKPAKKKKAKASDDDDDKPVKKKKTKASDDDDAPKAKKKKASDDDDKPAKKTKKKAADDDDDKPAKKKKASDDDDDKPVKKKAKTSDDDDDVPKAKKKKAKASDDDDVPKAKKKKASDDDDVPKAKKKKAKASDDDDVPKAKKKKASDDDDDKPAKKTKKKAADDDDDKPVKKKKASDDDDDAGGSPFAKKHVIDDDDKPAKKTKKKAADDTEDKPAKKSLAKKHDDDDKPEVPAKKHEDDFDPLSTKKTKKSSKVDTNEIEMDEAPSEGAAHQDDAPPLGDAVAAPVVANPIAIDDRPLTLPKDRLEVHGGFPITAVSVPGAMAGTTTSSTSLGFAIGATYGAGAKAEVGADYQLSLNPGSIKGPFAIHGAYRVAQKPKLDVALAATLAVDFIAVTDPVAMTTSTSTLFGLQLGAWARYRITPTVSLFSGLPATPSASPSQSKLAFPLPPQSSQLVLGLNNGGAVAIELPIGVGVQVIPKIYAFAATNLANIRIANTANGFLFADFIPIALGGFYSLDKLDIGAVFADDLKQGAGNLRFELAARYAIK